MKRGVIRWAWRLLALAACAGLLVVLAHTPPVRAFVLSQLMSRLSAATGFVFAASRLEYDMLRLTVAAEDLRVTRPGPDGAPVFLARHVRMGLNRRTLSGSPEVEWVEADGLSLVIDMSAATAAGSDARAFRVPVFAAGRVALRHADIEVIDPDGIGHLVVRDVSLDATGGASRRLEGPFTVGGGLTLDSPEARVRIDRFEGRAFLDGDAIGLRPVVAVAGQHRVALDGSVVFTGPSPAYDLGLAGDLDVGLFSAWFPALPPGDGPLQITGRVTGPLDDAQLQFAARTPGVALPDIRVPASTAEVRISRSGIYVDRMRASVGTGWIEAAGRLPLGDGDPASRVSLSWADVSVASLAGIFPLLPVDPIGAVATGSASLTWPGTALEFSTLSGDITSRVRVDPELDPARITVAGSAGRWRLQATQSLDQGGTTANLDATIRINPAAVADSAVLGTITISSANMLPAAVDLKRAFPALPDVAAWIADTPLALDGTVDGTLGAPRLSGTVASSR
ncbi:MAG TPA: hypothetical protein VLN08_12870, partial [Vicinamibacterales bacterium]|nr:hypothetical protein [Vicinamibacterales bacterium]